MCARKRSNCAYRRGFTLIELLLAIGIISILAAVVIVAINPTKQLEDARDAKRRHNVKQIQGAMNQYVIDEEGFPSEDIVPEGRPIAAPICRAGIDTDGCINYDALVPTYFAELPVDPVEENADVTGYLTYQYVGHGGAISAYLSDCGIPGLVGYWQLNEGAGTATADASGYGNHGTLMNMEEGDWVTDAPSGDHNPYALSLDGVNEHVEIPDDDILNPSAFTLTAWVKLTNISSAQAIVRKYTGVNSSVYGFAQSSGRMYAQVRDDSNVLVGASVAFSDTANWRHIAMTFSNDTVRLFIDGTEVATADNGSLSLPDTSGVPLQIGIQGANDAPYTGLVDDVRIYDHVLSNSQIYTLASCVGW